LAENNLIGVAHSRHFCQPHPQVRVRDQFTNTVGIIAYFVHAQGDQISSSSSWSTAQQSSPDFRLYAIEAFLSPLSQWHLWNALCALKTDSAVAAGIRLRQFPYNNRV
jgi:hypothetical protein